MKIFGKYIEVLILLITFLFGSISIVNAASCTMTKPNEAPELFQIDVTKNSAKLYFTPVNNAVTGYTIIYGLERGRDDFGVSFPLGKYDGVIDFTINSLSPNTTYYFRVRADNGCRQGWTSDSMSVQTNWDFKVYTKYKNQSNPEPTRILDLPSKTKLPAMETPQAIDIKITPEITQTPKKNEKKINFIALFQNFINMVSAIFQ